MELETIFYISIFVLLIIISISFYFNYKNINKNKDDIIKIKDNLIKVKDDLYNWKEKQIISGNSELLNLFNNAIDTGNTILLKKELDKYFKDNIDQNKIIFVGNYFNDGMPMPIFIYKLKEVYYLAFLSQQKGGISLDQTIQLFQTFKQDKTK